MASAFSGEKIITIEGKKYQVRTATEYQTGLGVQGTLSTTAPIRYTVQYRPEPFTPLTNWTNLGERDVTNKNNWIFTPAAGTGFQKALIENSPSSLTTSLDDATTNALSKSAGVTKQQATQILQVAPNKAPIGSDPNQPEPLGTTTKESVNLDNVNPANLEINDGNKELSDNTEKIETNYGSIDDLRYPFKLNLDTQDCIQFKMFRYVGRSLGAISEETIGNTKISGPGATTRRGTEIVGTVTLPIQPSISDSNGVEWGGTPLNPIQAYAASIARGAMDENGSVADLASDIFGKVSQNLKELKNNKDLQNAFKLYLAQEAVGIQGLLSRTTGAILNPNLELLFNGPTLRNFNFTFRLSPRSAKEAENVKKIIRFFKQGMSVKTSNTTVFLKAPNIFQIKYISGSKDHPSLNRIKDCALLGCDVDYTPDGTYMTFNDSGKTMTSYQLTLRFGELEPIYEDDYFNSGLNKGDIGF
jgi:hypothetical protein